MTHNSQKTNDLLASVAVFSHLYNNAKSQSVSDILGEFITSAVVEMNLWSTGANEVRSALLEMFGFEIPEAVVRSVLRNKLKGLVENKGGVFHFDKSALLGNRSIEQELESVRKYHSKITDRLISFVEYNQSKLDENDRTDLEKNFYRFLMGNGLHEKYTDKISAFVLRNSKDQDFREGLNLIREGLILYQGIRHSADLNSFGVWSTDLTIFLSPEHLFSALGYNGLVFEDLFQDFYKLVNEINNSNKNRGNEKRVSLRYFKESISEVDSLFNIATDIKRGNAKLTTYRPAMQKILTECRFPSDVAEKRVLFHQELKQMGILLQQFDEGKQYAYSDYNVEDRSIIEEVKKESIRKNSKFDENECQNLLKIFTRINYYRGGKSKDKFENIGSIFISESSLALYLAHNNRVKFEERDIPFAKNLEYITSTFWFKLKKGFSNDHDFPKSFDVVTKAQIILSSHTNSTIANNYEKLQKDLREGKISIESANELNNFLREHSSLPEDITYDNVENSLKFIFAEDSFNDYIREKERQKQDLAEARERLVKLELEILEKKRLEEEEKEKEKEDVYRRNKIQYGINRWKAHVKQNNKLALIFAILVLLTSAPILGTLLKFNELFTEPYQNWQMDTWIILFGGATLYIIEILGRAYIFPKAKILAGWNWIVVNLNRDKLRKYETEMLTEFEDEFKQE